jgi:hypothetical protein
VTDRGGPHVGLAIVRANVDEAGIPVIRVVLMDDLFRDEQDIVTTCSPDHAGATVTEWLRSALGHSHP